MIEKFRAKLKNNGQSFKWFWLTNLKGQMTYQYFITQINGHSAMKKAAEDAIFKFMLEK